MNLRPYQQEASDAAIKWIRRCVDPCVIEAATGAGKSHIIADVARRIHAISGKKILCTAPSKELVEQNYAKFLATGSPASIYSASIRKEMVHPVVFGTPQTIANSLQRFGDNFAAIIMDEAHGITPTMRAIVDHITTQNRRCRVIGMTATPYRMTTGYIYANDYERGPVQECADPFFHSLVYRIGARRLINDGYLTPPIFANHVDGYDTSGLILNSRGQFDADDIDKAFVGRGRKTASIVADIVEKSAGRRGVLIFAATVAHAHEVMESLPPSLSAIITGQTPKAERERTLSAFQRQEIKYLVNVAVLTTGFDATHVDVIAIMRATESVGLLQQIIGRGTRLHDGKADFLVLDYAENMERHCPGGDVFEPVIKVRKQSDSFTVTATCPWCTHQNVFAGRPNPDGYGVNAAGEFVDLRGETIKNAEGAPIPAHFGRRCQGETIAAGTHVQCGYFWSHKRCPECDAENDIAARYCGRCRAEIVDPNEKLREEAARMASDPYQPLSAAVSAVMIRRWPGRDGKPDTARIDYQLEGASDTVSEWVRPDDSSRYLMKSWSRACAALFGGSVMTLDDALTRYERGEYRLPAMVVYRRKQGTKFFDIMAVE